MCRRNAVFPMQRKFAWPPRGFRRLASRLAVEETNKQRMQTAGQLGPPGYHTAITLRFFIRRPAFSRPAWPYNPNSLGPSPLSLPLSSTALLWRPQVATGSLASKNRRPCE